MLQKYKANLPVIRASTSYVSAGASLGDATMVFHNAVVTLELQQAQTVLSTRLQWLSTDAVLVHILILLHGLSYWVMSKLVKGALSALALSFFRHNNTRL